ncbi:Plasma membrane sulfite pump involved in sulfite metabolism [Botryosphaeria dothidea]
MTAVWLLPAATPIVTASNGATVASMLSAWNQQHALWTLMVSYVLWGIGLPMAVVTLGIYFHRLTMHKLPPREAIITVFMPVGPLGQASYTIMNLGKMALELFPETGSIHPMAGGVFYIVGFGTAIILWGFGLVWLFFAVANRRPDLVSRSRDNASAELDWRAKLCAMLLELQKVEVES